MGQTATCNTELKLHISHFSIIRIRQIYRRQRIVAGNAIFNCQNHCRRLSVFEKNGIVTHTQAQQDIEFGFGVIE